MSSRKPQSLRELTQPQRSLAEEREWRKQRVAANEARRQLEAAIKHIDHLETQVDTLLGLSERKNAKPWKQKPVSRGQAAAVFVVSDIHIGEVVRSDTVLGLNEFNHDVCERRIERATHGWLRMLEKERSIADIREGVVFLGGDLIGGKIHSDQAEVNDLGIASSVQKAEECLERMLRTIAESADLKHIHVACLSGNHDRTTQKVQHSSFYENSNASIVYAHLRKRFSCDKRVSFTLGKGEYQDIKVFDWNIRLTHGHRVKFAGGIGGLTIPWNKHVIRLNKAKHADFTIGGHMHTWTYSSDGCFLVNGSIIGTTNYSLPLGHQEPTQAYLTIDKDRCVTAALKVFCE